MARFNEILVGRYNRFMQKLLSMKGPANLVTLSDEMQAMFPLYNGVENRYLESWERFSFQFNTTAVAAQFSQAQIRNPSGSNVIAVVEKISFTNFAGATDQPVISYLATSADMTNIGTTTQFDVRTRPHGSLIASQQTNAAGSISSIVQTQIAVGGVTQDVILTDDQELPILPGIALQAFSQIVNQALHGTFWWRERFLEDSERA